jgi:hypothetical protein
MQRNAAIAKELEKVEQEFLTRRGNGASRDQVREVESSLVDAAITLPPPISRHVNSWNSPVQGQRPARDFEGGGHLHRQDHLRGCVGRCQSRESEDCYGHGALVLRDVWDALESLCGASGWTALTRRGEA